MAHAKALGQRKKGCPEAAEEQGQAKPRAMSSGETPRAAKAGRGR